LAGPDVINAQDRTGDTPLHIAVSNGDRPMVRMLLSHHNARADILNKKGCAAEAIARQWDDAGMIKILKGTNPEAEQAGDTALHKAVRTRNHTEIRALLASQEAVDAKNAENQTALELAVENRDEESVRLLLARNADANIPCAEGKSLLYLAMRMGSRDITLILIENRADSTEGSILHLALDNRQYGIAKSLIEHGANVESTDEHGNTPLHRAVDARQWEVVKALFDRRISADIENAEGETPLHIAARRADGRMVQALLDYGADRNKQDKTKATPLHRAVESGQMEIVETLLQGAVVDTENAEGETALHIAARISFPMVNLLVTHGADVRRIGGHGNTLLHMAVAANQEALVQALLEWEYSVDAENAEGETALHIAARQGNVPMLKALLDHGAKANCIDQAGNTPLHMAVAANQEAL
jgi:ankyrin repeat protein